MKKVFLSVLSLFLAVASQAQNDSSMYTIQQCIDYALQNHNSIKNAELDYKNSELKVKETKAIGLPQINGKVDFIDYLKVQSQFLPANAFNPAAPAGTVAPVAFGVQYSSNASATASQMIFDGSFFVGLKAAKTYKELYKKAITQTKTEVVESVSKAYYGVLVNQQRLKLLENNSSLLDKLYSDTKAMYEAGFVDKVSLQRIEVSKNNLNVELSKLKNFSEVNYALLKFQMGMPLTTPLEIEDNLETVMADMVAMDEVTANASARVDYQQLEVQKTLMELDVKNNKVTAYPKLSAFGTVGANIGSYNFGDVFNLNDWRNYSLIGLQLDVPIFSSFRRKYVIDQSIVELDKVENNINMMEQSIELETLQQKLSLQNNLESIDLQKLNMALADEVYHSIKLKYDQGMASNYEVIDAETSLKESQTNYYAALYDAIVSKINLDKAAGTLYNE